MTRVEVPSYPISIFIAGDSGKAEAHCRYLADWWQFCVTVTPTTYAYTGGQEVGVIVGLINYPRFPKTPEALFERAEDIAASLRRVLGQQSYTIQAPDKTVWFSHREEDATPTKGLSNA